MRVKMIFLGELKDIVKSREIILIIREDQTLRELLLEVTSRYGKTFKEYFLNPVTGDFMPFIVLVNGKPKRVPNELDVRMREGDEVTIVQPLSGG